MPQSFIILTKRRITYYLKNLKMLKPQEMVFWWWRCYRCV